MSSLLLDVRYALRSFRQAPGFVAVALIALALGVGANSAIFSVLNAVLLRPLPYPHPERLVMIWEDYQRRGGPREEFTNPANFFDWRDQAQSFEAMYAFTGAGFTLTGDGEPERVFGASVTPGLFATLGTQPSIGRAFTGDEEKPGGPRVVVLTHGLWQRRFGANASIVGQSILFNGNPYQVIGVMPAGVRLPVMTQAEFFVPLQAGRIGRGNAFLRVVARMKSGATLAQARAEMATIASRLAQQYPDANAEVGSCVVGLQDQLAGETRTPLLILMGAVNCVLLIACANVANLQLARASVRQKEIAIRIALGAGRGQLMRQLLTESILLGGAGGVLGLLLASAGVRALMSTAPNLLPEIFDVSVDVPVAIFSLLVGAMTGVVFGIVPAWQASRPAVQSVLKEGGAASAGASGQKLRAALAIAEIALSIVLLVAAGLLMRSFFAVLSVDSGFEPRHLLTLDLMAPRIRYPEGRQVAEFYSTFLSRLKSFPPVENAAGITSPPFSQNRMDLGYVIEGDPPLAPGHMQAAWVRAVTPEYFSAAKIRMLAGRAFSERDTVDAPQVVIVNESLARLHWPNGSAVGKRLAFGDAQQPQWQEIVGVVGNVRSFGLEQEEPPAVYQAYWAAPVRALTFVVRSPQEPGQLAPQLRSLLREMDRDMVLGNLTTMESRLAGSLAQRRFMLLLLGAFAALALVLAAVGIYGVMSFSVTQRTREMGIRMALGAARGDVLRMVVGQGMALVAVGIVIGVATALGLSQLMATQLYGISPHDSLTYAGISIILGLAALLACFVPARRATQVDPLVALRYE